MKYPCNLSLIVRKPVFGASDQARGKPGCADKEASQILEKIGYRKVSEFLDARKFWCKESKIQTNRPNLRVFCQKTQME